MGIFMAYKFTVKTQQGFTLVELSIVIIIIGFLIAGIAGATSLIKQAENTKIISSITESQTAFNTFKARYNAIPGDMDTAASYWPGCGATANACNGDADGFITHTYANNTDELLPALKHLNLAGLLNGASIPQISATYTAPVTYAPMISSTIGYNFTNIHFTDPVSGPFQITPDPANAMIIGASRTGNVNGLNGMFMNSALTPQNAFNIDNKIDDGSFDGTNNIGNDTGNVRVIMGADQFDASVLDNCINFTGFGGGGQYYKVASNTTSCIMYVLIN